MSTTHRSSGHEAFADLGRRADDLVPAHAVTDVAVVGRGEAFLVDPIADPADLLFDFVRLIMTYSSTWPD